MPVTIVGKCTVILHKNDGTQTSAVFKVTHHNELVNGTSRDIGYANFPAIDCPLSFMTPITQAVQTQQQHNIEQPRVTRKTQSSITIGNITHKRTNNSVADVLSRVSPLLHRSADVRPEDATPLNVLSNSIPDNQSCLDSVKTKTLKDSTLQQPGLSQYKMPAAPWKRIGIDYFKWSQQRYLLISDILLFTLSLLSDQSAQ